MLKGLALTPPVIGRISIGKVVEKNGKRLPEKDDEFTVTAQVQNKDGWVNHPVDETLRKTPGAKLWAITVRLLFDDPDLNLRANYSMFDRQTGRPQCVGNGETCRRSLSAGVQTLSCPSPEACDLAKGGFCKPYARLNVRIGDDDELGSFVFRTTGFNSIRTLSARLSYFHAVSGGQLSTLPLELRLRGKSAWIKSCGFWVTLACQSLPQKFGILRAIRKLDGGLLGPRWVRCAGGAVAQIQAV